MKGLKCGHQTLSSLGRQSQRNKFNLFLLQKKLLSLINFTTTTQVRIKSLCKKKKERKNRVYHLRMYTYHPNYKPFR